MLLPRSVMRGVGMSLVAMLLTAVPQSLAQERSSSWIRGVVRDTTGQPIALVNIQFGLNRRTVSDDSGRFQIRAAGSGTLIVRRIGYQPATIVVDAPADTVLTIMLVPLAQSLPMRVVEASRTGVLQLHGFYERMRDVENGIGHGYFITPEDIERRQGASLATDLLQGIPAVRLLRRATLRVPMGTDGCGMTVYLDGIRLNEIKKMGSGMLPSWVAFGKGSEGTGGTADLDYLTAPGDIAGIEVYPRAVGAPPKFQSLNGNCGVILVWTK
jgi:hypothetical protein